MAVHGDYTTSLPHCSVSAPMFEVYMWIIEDIPADSEGAPSGVHFPKAGDYNHYYVAFEINK